MTDDIAALQEQKAKLEAEIEAKKAQRLTELVETVRKMILDAGYRINEVTPLLAPRKVIRKSAKVLALKTDPSKTYSKGPMPAWMRDAIVAAGMDPKEKKSREIFKTLHMEQAA